MHLSQEFHVEIARAHADGKKPVRWILDHEAFFYLKGLM